jgi:hypothetical protein
MNPWRLLPMAALALSAAALAQPQAAPPPSFETLDANRDGSLGRHETLEEPLLWAAFRGADSNGDGVLERHEFDEEMALGAIMRGSRERELVQEPDRGEGASAGASAPHGGSALFRSLDRNGDGSLSDAELESGIALRRNWIAFDRDDDGRIHPGELAHVPSR